MVDRSYIKNVYTSEVTKTRATDKSIEISKIQHKKHMIENQIHEHKVEEKLKREKGEPDKDSRSKKVGLDLF